MAVSTADSSCLRMLIRIMTGFLQIIPMRISGISGRRGCTQSLLLTCLRQTSNLCLATTHVSIWNLDCLPALPLLFYLNFIFSLNLEFCLRSGWATGFRWRGAFSCTWTSFLSFLILLVCFVSVISVLPLLKWTWAFYFLIELQRWCLSMVFVSCSWMISSSSVYLELCLWLCLDII